MSAAVPEASSSLRTDTEAVRLFEMTKDGYLPAGSRSAYYTFSPVAGQRVVVIDAYDWSVLGRPAGDKTLVRDLKSLPASCRR